MRLNLFLILIFSYNANSLIWLPFANLGSMFETLKETAFASSMDPNDSNKDHLSIFEFGKDILNGIGNFISNSIDDDRKFSIAKNIRGFFNVTTTTANTPARKHIIPPIIKVNNLQTTKKPTRTFTRPRYPFHLTTTLPETTTTFDIKPEIRFSTTTEPLILKFTKIPTHAINFKKIENTTPNSLKSEATTTPISSTTVSTTQFESTTITPLAQTTANLNTTTATISTTSTTTKPPSTTTISTTSTTTEKASTSSETITTEQILVPSKISTTTMAPTTSTVHIENLRIFTKTAYPIWPTTPRTTTSGISMNIIKPSWRQITPEFSTTVMTTTEPYTNSDFPSEVLSKPMYSTTQTVPHIIKAIKYTRPPINEKIVVTKPPISTKYETCVPNSKCTIRLKSFESNDALFQYCYSHSSMIDESMKGLLQDSQMAVYPAHLAWHNSVTPEVIQLIQTLMSLYRPSRCLVIGVFTGLGLLGIAERVDSRGIIVALEHPAYGIFWEKVGQKRMKKIGVTQMSRIQLRTSEGIEKSLPRLAANEPNTFDFIFLDDLKRENYFDDYEHSVRLLRSGGLLVINQALNGGGVLSSDDTMTNEDKVIRNMNIRIKQDSRVTASLLPYGGGTWIISKR